MILKNDEFDIVTKEHFLERKNYMLPRCNVPGRRAVGRQLLDDVKASVKEKVHEIKFTV